MLAKVYITLKQGVLDPQGKAVKNSLASLGYNEVKDIRVGKYIEVKLDEVSKEVAQIKVDEMCKRLLANTTVESYTFDLIE
ncbi:phosphoribosylformylglycinamidine synthase subunit PurS [bacterium]|nr:phosphoribosylformylglycinamidine synthase subunit PurS [bacterium]